MNPVIRIERYSLMVKKLHIAGRMAWALHELFKAGKSGLTTSSRPAPRWSDYMYLLRRTGFTITTEHEKHGGAYPGTHARYKLASPIKLIEIKRAPGARRAA